MASPEIELEDDATPLALAIAAQLARRLEDPAFADATAPLAGIAAVRHGTGPEAATIELGGRIGVRHGTADAQVVATVGSRGRLESSQILGEQEHPELGVWLHELLTPAETQWREAGTRFWQQLAHSPGAPPALVLVNLDDGESERFGEGERAYEIHGHAEDLVALLEGRAALIEEAFERRVYIRGAFAEISVLEGAALRVRLGLEPPGA